MLQLLRRRSAFLLVALMVLCVPITGWTQANIKEAAKAAKVSSDLLTVIQNKGIVNQAPVNGLQKLNLFQTKGNSIAIEALTIPGQNAQALLQSLQVLGLQNGSVYSQIVTGYIPIDKLANLKDIGTLKMARPSYKPIKNVGAVTSQGDVAIRADIARSTYGVTGAGVKVGVMSDSYDALNGAAAGVASGDLPAGVQVLSDFIDPDASDEGRAMAEIVHDVAPGSGIAFHTAFVGGEAGFAQGIRALATAGSKVITDDVSYFAEPFFQDGLIAQAVDDVVTNSNVTYFSSAGNSARSSYQNAYSGVPFSSPAYYSGASFTAHNFGGGDNRQTVTVPAGRQIIISFQWDDPFFSVSGGTGARTDMDLLVYFNGALLGNLSSFEENIGGDPVEIIGISNGGSTAASIELVLVKQAGPDPTIVKWINFGNTATTEYDTKSSTLAGHANASRCIGVGAAFWGNTPAFNNALSTATLETFSSAGGTPILFNTAGQRIASVTRQKPEITAVDGGNTTFFFADSPSDADAFPNFFGTSAAAPHAAAVAALMKEKVPTITPATILSTLKSTALDMDDPATTGFDSGFDSGTGFGFIQADRALQAISNAAPPTVVNVIAPQSGTVGVGFNFTIPANTFSDPNGDALSYTVTGLPVGLTFAGTAITGTPSMSGVSTVTVKATDPGSLSASTTFQLTISPAPPVNVPPSPPVGGIPNQVATVGTAFTYQVPVFTDPDAGQTLTYSVTGLPANGLSFTAGSRTISGTPSTSGTVGVTVRANDGNGGTASSSFTITINAAPVVPPANTAPTLANVIAPQSGTVGVGFSFTIAANTFSDPEGQALTYTVTGLPPGLSASGRIISGTPSLSGVSTVTVKATDPGSLSASTTFQLTISPAPPVNVPPSPPVGGIPNQVATVGTAFTYQVPVFTDPDAGQTLTYSVTGLPANGLSFTAGSRTISGTPSTSGTVGVTVRANDGNGGTASSSFTITINAAPVNMAPTVANVVAPQSGTVGVGFSFTIAANTFSDPEGQALTYTVTGLPPGLSASGRIISGTPSLSGVSTVTVKATDPGSLSASTTFMLTISPALVTPPPAGPFSITGVTTVNCTPLSAGKRTVSFTPQYAGLTGQPISFSVTSELLPTTAPGPYSLTLYIDNPSVTLKATQTGTAGEASFVYNWLAACTAGTPPPVNLPPVASTPANQTAVVSQPFAYVIPAFSDPNNDVLTYTVSGLPAGLNFTAGSRTISGTPSLTGVSMVSVKATDPGSLSASASFMLTVISAPVTPPPAGPFSITGVTTVNCTPLSAGKRTVSFTPQYAGLTGQPISFSVTSELLPTTAPGPYSLTLYIDNPSVTLKATQTGTAGEASFVYNWLAACTAGTPPPVNLPPVASTPANQTAVVSQPFTYVIPAFSDPNNDVLTYTVSGLPAGLNFTAGSRTISGTPSLTGVSMVSVKATDPGSLSASASFMLTVISAPVTPPPAGPFSITGVTTVNCTPLSAGKRTVSFTPQYAGLTGQPISFSVTSELLPTTAPGPYSLTLYIDNPSVTLKATQTGTAGEASFVYNWLAACNAPARQGVAASSELQAELTVSLYPNPVGEEFSIGIKGAQGQKVGIVLSDVSGRALTNTSVDVTTPDHQERLRFNQERPGLYLLRVSAGGQMVVLKVIKH